MEEQNKVVIKLSDGLIKGYLTNEMLQSLPASGNDSQTVSIRLPGTDGEKVIRIDEAKGIFIVKDFDGKADHADLRFHDGTAPANYLWVRLTFLDGEVLEGMIENACTFVVSKGIWVTPSDPTGNNLLIYATKSHLRHFEVLGLRQKMHRRSV